MGSFRSEYLVQGDDCKAFVAFKGCMESIIAFAYKATVERPFDYLKRSFAGSAKDTYVVARSQILSMR